MVFSNHPSNVIVIVDSNYNVKQETLRLNFPNRLSVANAVVVVVTTTTTTTTMAVRRRRRRRKFWPVAKNGRRRVVVVCCLLLLGRCVDTALVGALQNAFLFFVVVVVVIITQLLFDECTIFRGVTMMNVGSYRLDSAQHPSLYSLVLSWSSESTSTPRQHEAGKVIEGNSTCKIVQNQTRNEKKDGLNVKIIVKLG
jgi:hypothetical protein